MKKEALIQDALQALRLSGGGMMMAADASVAGELVGFWDVLLPILLPLFLEWFKNCLKGPLAKKAAQIDDEQRRQAQIRRGVRKERKLHKKAEKLFRSQEVLDAVGREMTDAEKDYAYEQLVQYAFENRNAVARLAATKG